MSKNSKNPDQIPMGFMLPETSWQAPTSLPDLSGYSMVAIDTENRDDGLKHSRGPGWVYNAGWVSGVAVAAGDFSTYIPIRHPDTACFSEDEVARWLRKLHMSDTRVVYHRAVYDLGWLSTMGDVPPPRRLDDTMIMEFILDENQLTYNLDDTCKRHGIRGKDERLLRTAADALGCDPKADLWRMPARYVGPYAAQDAAATLELAELLLPQISAQFLDDAYKLEVDLIPMINAMRRRGIPIDQERAPQVRSRLLQERNMYLSQLSERLQIGRPIEMGDVNSPKFLESIFRSENLPVPKTPKGNASFKTDEIEKLDHWLPELITGARKMNDAGEKFVGNYIMGYTHLGKIHAEIHQTKSDDGGTRTTRMAYSDPPLQQMPGRNPKIKKMIRGLFLPEKGKIWGALDYSQQEFRLIVHFAYVCKIFGVEKAVQMYRNNPKTDFHDLAAELTRLPRRRAKDVNFAKAFGAGGPKFALMTGMDLQEALAVMAQYDEELPFVKGLGDFCMNRASNRGYLRLLDGARTRYERWEPRWTERGAEYFPPCDLDEARRRIADPNHPWYRARLKRAMVHKAMNSLIQGSAARQTKMVMRECWREGYLPMLQMHDELDFDFEQEADAWRVRDIMRDTVKLEVPVVVDAEFGINWGRAAADEEKLPDGTKIVHYDASWASAWEEMRRAA